MEDALVGKIIRSVRPIGVGDSIGRASGAIRMSGLTEIPVVGSGRVVGMVSERAVLAAFASGDPGSVARRPVSDIMSNVVISVNSFMSIRRVAEMLTEHGIQVAPVLNEYGGYLGIVTRPDVIGDLSLSMKPPSIGGLATPLGVYLTSGQQRGGVSDIGLFLTGVSIGLMWVVAGGIVAGVAWLVQATTRFDLFSVLNSTAVNTSTQMTLLQVAMQLLGMLFFGLLLKISPLSGYHAAEHQVVNAIENGEPLEPELVRSMPRVHARCGTNLLIAAVVFLMVAHAFTADVAVLISIFVLIFAWRTIGGYFQYYVTTKPPSDKQLASGIKAGNELLEEYRKNPSYRVTGWQRIWNTGMPQVMIGMVVTMSLVQIVHVPGAF